MKRTKTRRFACSVAASVLALAPVAAQAQDTTTSSSTTTSTTTTTMSTQPVQASGTVERYYTDQTGYVTAADVRTAEGTQMVHFAPGMGTRVSTTYPVGGTAQVWVSPNRMGTGHWDVVGVGDKMPAAGFWPAYTSSAIDMLEGDPYIVAGSKLVTVRGKLTNVVTNDLGEIVALILNGNTGMGSGLMTSGSRTGTHGMSGHLWASGNYSSVVDLDGAALVRVPREFRSLNPGAAGTRNITPLYRNDDIEVTGYHEAPLFGVVSIYPYRIASNTISVNGKNVAYGSLPIVNAKKKPLLGFNINLPFMGRSAESTQQTAAMGMGYSEYNPQPAGMVEGGATSGTVTPSTGTGTGTPGTQ